MANKLKAQGKKVKTSIYLLETLHWDLKKYAVERRMTDTAAMQEAIEKWVKMAKGESVPVSHEATQAERENMLAFADLLRHGGQHKAAILKSLKVFMNEEWPAIRASEQEQKKRKAG